MYVSFDINIEDTFKSPLVYVQNYCIWCYVSYEDNLLHFFY